MKLPDKVYDTLKWLLIVVVPAAITLLTVLTNAWHWNIPLEAIVATISGVATFVGVCVGISSIYYTKSQMDIKDFEGKE